MDNVCLHIENYGPFRRAERRAVVWTKRDERVYTAVVLCSFITCGGEERFKGVAFRLDGRNLPRGRYRIDIKEMSFMPWEALDGGDPAPSLKKAKSIVLDWLTQPRPGR